MQAKDILRGALQAYLAGLALHILGLVVLTGLWSEPQAIVSFTFAFAVVGAGVAILFTGASFTLLALLKSRVRSLPWWSAPLTTTTLSLLCVMPFFVGDPEWFIGLAYGVLVGLVTSLAFWHGAVGWSRTLIFAEPAG
ncbi:hypothetical protein [Gymnodinialimonas sp.]